LLGAETLSMDHDDAVLGHALAGEPVEPRLGIRRQRDPPGIEPQLGRGRELVDVLSTRTGGTDETDLDVVLVDREVAGNPQHGVTGGRDDPKRESDGRTRAVLFAPQKDRGGVPRMLRSAI